MRIRNNCVHHNFIDSACLQKFKTIFNYRGNIVSDPLIWKNNSPWLAIGYAIYCPIMKMRFALDALDLWTFHTPWLVCIWEIPAYFVYQPILKCVKFDWQSTGDALNLVISESDYISVLGRYHEDHGNPKWGQIRDEICIFSRALPSFAWNQITFFVKET